MAKTVKEKINERKSTKKRKASVLEEEKYEESKIVQEEQTEELKTNGEEIELESGILWDEQDFMKSKIK